MHGICRGNKVSREEMIALTVAIENYMAMDPEKEKMRCSAIVDRVMDAMKKNPVFRPYRVETGSVGQDYPRAFAEVAAPYTPDMIVAAMRANHVFVGMDAMKNAIYISPLNLTDEECVTVCNLLEEVRPEL